MTTTRDLIQRLAHELYKYECLTSRRPPDYTPAPSPLIAEARAYLSQPEPEELTDEELLAVLTQAVASFPPMHPEAKALSVDEYDWELEARKARAVIAADRARWGRPTTTQENN